MKKILYLKMRVGLATIILLSLALAYVSTIKPFEEVDPIEQEIVRNAIKKHWMDLKNYTIKGPKKTSFSGNIMEDIMTIKFRPPHRNATKMAMARTLQERMIKDAELALQEAQGMNTTNRRRRQLAPGSLSPSSLAEIYQAVECDEFLPHPNCDRRSLFVRNIDGTCNNLIFQTHGATFDIFSRLLPANYEDGIDEPRGFKQPNPFQPPLPSARLISRVIHQNDDKPLTLANVDENGLTHLVMQWGQFIDHDTTYLIEGGEGNEFQDVECFESPVHVEPEFCIDIPVPLDDPLLPLLQAKSQRDTLPFERSAPSCYVPLISAGPRAREIINQLTSLNDASMVYGSTKEEEEGLRLFKGGLLLEAGDQPPSVTGSFPIQPGTLPISPGPTTPNCLNGLNCFMAGDRRVSEQFSLSVMHTIWLREHNRLAKKLGQLNPTWSDEAIFQVARRIVIAEVQNIVFSEYLPIIIGKSGVDITLGPYKGYDASADPRTSNEFATAAYRFGHSQIRSGFIRLDASGNQFPELSLTEAFFNSKLFFDPFKGGTDPIIRGLVNSNSRRVDEFINIILTNKLFKTLLTEDPGANPPLDLAARNIQRGRDHGLPTYLQVRRFCKALFDIESPIADVITMQRLQALYGADLDFADLFPGGLAEERFKDSLLGATFTCIIGLTFKNLRDGDRFFYQNDNVFTSTQLKALESITIASVICANTQIGSIQPEAFRVQNALPCSKIPSLDLDLFKEDSVGEMIENEDFSLQLFPGQADTIRLNNEFRAYLSQQQADLTAVNDLNRLIGGGDNGVVSYLKVRVDSFIGEVSSSSYQFNSYKSNYATTEFETGRTSGPSATCVRILTSFTGKITEVYVSVYIPGVSCHVETISAGLSDQAIAQFGYLWTEVPVTASEVDGVYDTVEECRLGHRAAITGGVAVLNPTIGVGVHFACH